MKLQQVRTHALSLEAVTEEPHHHFSSFRVRGKIFVTVPPDEKHIHVFLPEEEWELALALHSEFTEKLLWGSKVFGIRVALALAKPQVVKQLVEQAHRARVAKDAGPPRQRLATGPHPKS